jgi:hypothetical protein
VTTVKVFTIEDAGSDYVLLRDGEMDLRVNFDDDETFTKEETAGLFRGLVGMPVCISNGDVDGQFFIAVDFWPGDDNSFRVVPFNFAVSTVEMSL